ncbi:hypothetical protein T4E_9007 [Trichinella pseudospiralis]|uniref:Uncharacterized protein n=1 Tax=Trichinella pseudospiralis TaxID=6337 RepID=A0A0V1F9R7_TRIPS|nr:hypothetical protein T4E_9007 [Trichinella pseudospiralis]KRY82750.1 hypothetical protein T4D_16740 [Trichinella pseudospiralis]
MFGSFDQCTSIGANGDGPHYIVHQKRVSGWGMDDQWPSLFFCSTGQYGLVETAPLSTCPVST